MRALVSSTVNPFDSLASWTNPERPSTPSYTAIARYGARNQVFTLPLAAVTVALFLVAGQYGVAALVVGAIVTCGPANIAGVAVAFDDHAVAGLATGATAFMIAGTAAVARTVGLGDDTMLVLILTLIVVPGALAVGLAGYTAAERAVASADHS